MAKTTKKNKLPRDWNAVDAHFRNSAGAMKDRRGDRGGASNTNRNCIDFYLEDMEDTLESLFCDSFLGDNFGGGGSSSGEGT